MSEEQDWEDYRTGQFCRHWSDPCDCFKVCATCGHTCTEHELGDNSECMEEGCDCKEWKDKRND